MSERECSIEGCTKSRKSRGWCPTHYARWQRNGDPLFTQIEMHGLKYTPEYKTWECMKQRCLNPTNADYKDWGGRGITVCERWMSFENFYEDMGPKPEPKSDYSINRIDNDGNYEPGNCKWSTNVEQRRNRRGVKLSLSQAEAIRALHSSTKHLSRYDPDRWSCVRLAEKFGVDRTSIGLVVNNKIWQEAA